MTKPLVIAIDGASGSGKSSTARGVATRLGLAYLDTGAMYRAVTVAYLDSGIDAADPAAITDAVVAADITDPTDQWVTVNGRDVTDEDDPLAARLGQRLHGRGDPRMPREPGRPPAGDHRGRIQAIVAEGRDITTVVAPDADVRLLLSADPEIRMARRRLDHGGRIDDAALRDRILRRDADDSTLVNFTTAADGVVSLDGSLLSLEQVIDAVVALAERARPTGEEGGTS